MITAQAHDVIGLHELQMCEAVARGAHAVRGARGLDRVNRGARRPIADDVKMQIEARQMHALGVFHDHSAIVFELAARELALAGMVAMGAHECRDVEVFLAVRAHVLAKC